MNGQPISDETVLVAQKGDSRVRENLIADSIPWIKKLVRKHTFMISVENTDEFSIALDAFNTAIDRFSTAKQIPFRTYASILIRNRLIDWNRQRISIHREQSFSDMDIGPIPYEDRLEDPAGGIAYADIESEDSMIEVEYRLSLFGLSLDGLIEHFPKQRPTLLFCVKAARALSEDRELFEKTMDGKRASRPCTIPPTATGSVTLVRFCYPVSCAYAGSRFLTRIVLIEVKKMLWMPDK